MNGRTIFPRGGPDLSDDNISDDDVVDLVNATDQDFEDSPLLLSPKRMSHSGKISPLLQ